MFERTCFLFSAKNQSVHPTQLFFIFMRFPRTLNDKIGYTFRRLFKAPLFWRCLFNTTTLTHYDFEIFWFRIVKSKVDREIDILDLFQNRLTEYQVVSILD